MVDGAVRHIGKHAQRQAEPENPRSQLVDPMPAAGDRPRDGREQRQQSEQTDETLPDEGLDIQTACVCPVVECGEIEIGADLVPEVRRTNVCKLKRAES